MCNVVISNFGKNSVAAIGVSVTIVAVGCGESGEADDDDDDTGISALTFDDDRESICGYGELAAPMALLSIE